MRKRQSTDYLPFGSLSFDPAYQRQVIPARVRWLVANWDLSKVGVITVSIRPDDQKKAYVVDGQHRVRAAMDLGLGDTKILCHIYRGLTKEEESRLFLSNNNVRPVTPFDKFRAGIVAKDPVAVGVKRMVEEHGWQIKSEARDGTIACVSELMKVYSRDPGVLDDTLSVLTEAWGTRAEAVERPIITGLASIFARYDGELDRGVLVKKLGKYRGGPGALTGDARGLSDIKSMPLGRAVAEIVVATYNKSRRSGQLTPL